MLDRSHQVDMERGLELFSSFVIQHERTENVFELLDGIAETSSICGELELSCPRSGRLQEYV
jgi:hypothetical protein